MTIPFLGILEKAKSLFSAKAKPAPSVPTPAVRVEKPVSERLHKVVMPSSTARPPQPDPYRTGGTSAPISTPVVLAPSAPKRDLPPAVALALQPKVERAISLQLADFVAEVPEGYIKSPETFDTSRRVLLKASEIEKGMASGKPSVSLATLYEQVPEIFLHSLTPGEIVDVPLPYAKVLEQFSQVQVRKDQDVDSAVPQLDTPFLQVTIEDTQRFGTSVEPVQTSLHPPVKVEPATAATIATAEPESVVREKTTAPVAGRKTISLSEPVPPEPPKPTTTELEGNAPARIPFNLPPNGMGGTASERVPASSGPSIPTGVPKPTTPTRIPFKITPPSDELRPKLTLVPGMAASEKSDAATEKPKAPEAESPVPKPAALAPKPIAIPTKAPPASTPGSVTAATTPPLSMPTASKLPAPTVAPPPRVASSPLTLSAAKSVVPDAEQKSQISLSLQVIMQNMPAFQLRGGSETIPVEARVELPLKMIQSQLASGRVAIAPKTFQAAIPETYRDLFVVDTAETLVLLPLQEVLKNLPSAALKMREDQEQVETTESFETPFSLKAAEDAKRFGKAQAAPEAKPVHAAPEAKPLHAAPEAKPLPTATPVLKQDKAEEPAAGTQPELRLNLPIPPLKIEPPIEKSLAIENKTAAKEAAKAEEVPELPLGLEGQKATKDAAEAKPAEEKSAQKSPIDIKGRKEKNEAKDIVARATDLPGVAACALTFADGLGLAGNFPPEVRAEGLCAMAPSLLQKVERHMLDTKLGALTAMTLHAAQSPVTFFMQGNICLSVLHRQGELPPQTQSALLEMAKALSKTYSQP